MAAASAGLVVALLVLSSLLSYTALLFGGLAPAQQTQGLFVMLASCALMGVVGAALSTLRFSVVCFDGSAVAVMASFTAGLAASLRGAGQDVLGATVLAGFGAIGLLSGAVLLVLGGVGGGAVIRFIPLQVMAGLFAASGWALLMGGLKVATGHAVDLGTWPDRELLLHVAPAVGWAVVTAVAIRRFKSPFVLPGLILLGVGLHHAAFAALGLGIDAQREAGWLLSAPGALAPVLVWLPDMARLVAWGALLQQAPSIAAAAAVACLLVLVNVNGLELATRQDVDLDRDLRANGIAALLVGLAGGVMGCLSMTRSALLFRLGGGTRRSAPIVVALAVGLLPMAAPGILGFVPRPVLGALLLVLGYGLLETWLWRVRERLTRAEWLTVPMVVLIAAWFGLPAAVFAGLALGCMTFAVMYSLGSPVRARYRGDVAQSHVDRSDAERGALVAQADAVLVLYLQGFLFFGTASRLLIEVKKELAAAGGRLRHLVLECANLDGLDGSARATLERMQQVTGALGIVLTYAALPAVAAARLGGALTPGPGLRVAATLDEALEWCEADMLSGVAKEGGDASALLRGLDPAEAAALEAELERSVVAVGAALTVQGEASDDLLFLERGQASVLVSFDGGPEVRVRQFGPGTMIGEIGFLLGSPRTATVRALTECEVRTLTRAALQRLEAERPEAALALQRVVMGRLSRRLLDKDQLIAALVRGTRRG